MLRIGFVDHAFSYRGTSRAILSYATGLAGIYGVESSIFFLKDEPRNSWDLIRRTVREGMIGVYPVSSLTQIRKDLDWVYYVTAASASEILELRTHWVPKSARLFVHQVGFQPPTRLSEGDIHAYTSQWQSYYFSGGTEPVLPYVIPSALRRSSIDGHSHLRYAMGIPADAVVLGRHGGPDTWNLSFANYAVAEALQDRDDLYFIFLGTPRFINHPRALFMESTTNQKEIVEFIDACDAMLHCRWEGETFGLACAEFLARSKPIITWTNSRERHHIYLADQSCIFYDDGEDLKHKLINKYTRNFLAEKGKLIPMGLITEFEEERILTRFLSMLD